MANPYSHPGPSYYPPPPGPHYPYGHGAPYYPYPMNHMPNGHSPPPPHHQPASPRMNGAARGGYNAHRAGGPTYQHFPHMPHHHHQQPYLQPQPMSPAAVPPASPYSHPQKYSPHIPHIPYSAPYNPPPNGVYSPAWAPPPTLSPLPKHLAMPTQLQPHIPPPEEHSPGGPPFATFQPTFEPSTDQPEPEAITVQPPVIEAPPAPSSSPPPPREHADPPPPEPECGPTDRSPTPTSPASTSSRLSQGTAAQAGSFVVWSRKPRDPSRAQGVMISARARPPQDMLEKAMDIRTPPQSPKLASTKLPEPEVSPLEQEPGRIDAMELSVVISEAPSYAATETTADSTTPATPVAESPSTANTSVLASSPVQPVKSLIDMAESAEPAPPAEAPVVSASQPPASAASHPQFEATTPVAPSVPKPAAKKSWASLLQTSDSQPSSSKSRLPTSSVQGFSIPAGLQSGSPSQASAAVAASGSTVRPEVLSLLTTGPTGVSSPPKIRPRGLVNTGNMCFANAVLQVLVYCPPFYRLFVELGRYLPGPVVGHQTEGSRATPLVDAIIQFLNEFGVKEERRDVGTSKSKGKEREEDFDALDSFIPTYVYDVMKEKKRFASMVTGHQEDAEEFLGFFLDTLEEELLSITAAPPPKEGDANAVDNGWLEVGRKNKLITTRSAKNAESPITRIFGGKFRSTLRAPHQRDSQTVEDWRSIRLDIQREQVHTIKDALQYISHPHSVEISSPTRPGQVIEASQQELIEALPSVLILHLKRFLYDTTVGDVVKLGKQVVFSPELEIGPDLITPANKPPRPVKYQLFGALYHHGQSASGGHYTLDILHPNRDLSDRPRQAWIRIDDELVSDVRPEDVFDAQGRDDRCAYLLFYRRITPGIPSKAWSQAAK